jgi:hypothetical protein
MLGARSLIRHLVVTRGHATAATAGGFNAAADFHVLDGQLRDAVHTAQRIAAALQPQDPNLTTINELLERLS